MSTTFPSKNGQTFVEKKPKRDWRALAGKLKTRRGAAVGLIIVMAFGTFVYLTYATFFRGGPAYYANQCSTGEGLKLAQSASEILVAEERERLASIVQKIESIENYQNDTTCLVPVVLSHVFNDDIDAVNENMALLEEGIVENRPFVDFGIYNDINNVRIVVEGLKTRNDEIQGNSLYF